ncbi:MAG: VanW family protein [Actinomycetaceae bacterium]|nr:VanW family protein [Actinomycetaceae bacterium]MDY6083608.1 VanW family protein [Actinomycetaceae bacterium]
MEDQNAQPQGAEGEATRDGTGAANVDAIDASDTVDAVDTGSSDATIGNSADTDTAHPETNGVRKLKSGSRRRAWWLWAIAVLVLIGIVYVGTAAATANTVPRGTTVRGVAIGGMSSAQAREALKTTLAADFSKAFTVTTQNAHNGGAASDHKNSGSGSSDAEEDGSEAQQTVEVDPGDFDRVFDPEATVAQVTGFSLNPVAVIRHVTGGSTLEPVVRVDQAKLSALISKIGEQLVDSPRNAAITYEETTPKVTEAVSGHVVDVDKARSVVMYAVPSRTGEPSVLPVVEKSADVSTAEAQHVAQSIAVPYTAEPMTVMVDAKRVEIAPKDLAANASFVAHGSTLVLDPGAQKLADLVNAGASEHLSAARDASFKIVNHSSVTIVPSQDGKGVDATKLAADISAVASKTGKERTVQGSIVTTSAAFSTQDAQKMGVKEVISSIATPLTSDTRRDMNLRNAGEKISNVLVKPGETFDLLSHLQPVDAQHGYVASGVSVNGFAEDAMGGGLSQVATNTFYTGYYAGFVDVEHHPHSEDYDRYPDGLDSTLWVPSKNMRWKNNTPYGVVVDAWVAAGKFHTQLWSTKYWDVTVTQSPKRNIVRAQMKYNPSPKCIPYASGLPGFTIDNHRVVSREGKVEIDTTQTVTYIPANGSTCTKPGSSPSKSESKSSASSSASRQSAQSQSTRKKASTSPSPSGETSSKDSAQPESTDTQGATKK